jgi:hypothetical protein
MGDPMNRRAFLSSTILALLAGPRGAPAQLGGRVYRVGHHGALNIVFEYLLHADEVIE